MDYQSMNHSPNNVVQGVYYGQNERVDELNQRVVSRQFADQALAPNYDPRPVSTKYALFPCLAGSRPINESAIAYPSYQMSDNFNPGSDKAPWSGFSSNIDVETVLRNQTVALQHSNQKEYIPDSNSDLFHTTIVSRPTEQPYPLLFSKPTYSTTATSVTSQPIGKNTFYNHTRTQLRSL